MYAEGMPAPPPLPPSYAPVQERPEWLRNLQRDPAVDGGKVHDGERLPSGDAKDAHKVQ